MPEVWFAASDATPLIPSILMPHLPQSRSVGIGTASWTSDSRDETKRKIDRFSRPSRDRDVRKSAKSDNRQRVSSNKINKKPLELSSEKRKKTALAVFGGRVAVVSFPAMSDP